MSLRPTIIFACAALVTSVLIYTQRVTSHRKRRPPIELISPAAPPIPSLFPAAMTTARRETDPALRAGKVRTVLHDWAAAEPDAAAAWVLFTPADERLEHATTLLIALANQPDAAARLARLLCEKDPAFIREHGDTLVTVLAENKLFAAALRFAEIGGPERAQWISLTLARWAEQQPQLAAEAALALAEPDGFPTVIASWSARDPAALAEFARQVPDPTARTAALTEALRRWIERDPSSAANWINHIEPGAEFDESAQALATLPPLLSRHPDVALGWAASIVDPALRATTLRSVVQSWMHTDTTDARRQITASSLLSAEDRATLLALLDRTPD